MPAPRKSGSHKSKSKKIALSGVLVAMAVVIMLLGGFLPLSTFSAPLFAGVFLMPLVIELGAKTALLAYAAVCILSLFLVPDKELVFFFIFLFGYYPLLRPYLSKIKNRLVRGGVKLVIFNAATAIVYVLLLFVFSNPAILEDFATTQAWMLPCVLLLANLTFLLYDVMVDKLRIVYVCRLRNKLFK